MRERAGQILKAACLVLAALLLYQLVRVGLRANPLARVTIPALPRLASDTNAPPTGGAMGMTNSAPTLASSAKGTNAPRSEAGTNSVALKTNSLQGTNLFPGGLAKASTTNDITAISSEKPGAAAGELAAATNSTAPTSAGETAQTTTNSPPAARSAANATTNAQREPTTNTLPVTPATNLSRTTTIEDTNILHASTTVGTSLAPSAPVGGTNAAASATNSPLSAKSVKQGTNSSIPPALAMGGMNFIPGGMPGGGRAPELPPEIKARVDRIYESELFGMVVRPMPMGLLGIAGNIAFLRSPSGQTGLVKEGDSLGEIKLLRIGINRVLVEQDGKKTELMIFQGYGGESLMPEEKATSK